MTTQAALVAVDLMSRGAVTSRADASISQAWQALFASGETHLIVIDRGRCVGVVDDRRIALEWPSGAFESRRRPVAALCVGVPTVVHPSTGLREVAALMTANGVTAVAVVDDDGRPIGLITAADLVRAMARVGLADAAGSQAGRAEFERSG